MNMQIKLFTIPVFGSDSIEEEMNRFLRGHRILQLERHFCADNGGYWAILIEYVDGDPLAEVPPASRRERKDFSEGMTEEEKLRFGHFKAIRKQLADQKSIPAYLVFTNEELALLARVPELCEDTVKGIKGIAPQRLKDYVHYFYVVSDGEASGQSDAEDSQSGESA